MSDKNNGWPAFPRSCGQCGSDVAGMSLRDYFACAAMQGDLACSGQTFLQLSKGDKFIAAREYYAMADAMLKVRDE